MKKKKCTKCERELSTNQFFKELRNKNKLDGACKDRQTKTSLKWKMNNKRKIDDWSQKYNMQYNHRLSWEEFEELVDEQEGKCAICNVELILGGHKNESTCVDHDHKTGAIRGILCRLCNRGIGLLKDDINILREAANYIERGDN